VLVQPRNLVIRVEGDVLDRAKKVALDQGTTISEEIRKTLSRLAGDRRPRPKRSGRPRRSIT
jgi:hypothetical protein